MCGAKRQPPHIERESREKKMQFFSNFVHIGHFPLDHIHTPPNQPILCYFLAQTWVLGGRYFTFRGCLVGVWWVLGGRWVGGWAKFFSSSLPHPDGIPPPLAGGEAGRTNQRRRPPTTAARSSAPQRNARTAAQHARLEVFYSAPKGRGGGGRAPERADFSASGGCGISRRGNASPAADRTTHTTTRPDDGGDRTAGRLRSPRMGWAERGSEAPREDPPKGHSGGGVPTGGAGAEGAQGAKRPSSAGGDGYRRCATVGERQAKRERAAGSRAAADGAAGRTRSGAAKEAHRSAKRRTNQRRRPPTDVGYNLPPHHRTKQPNIRATHHRTTS